MERLPFPDDNQWDDMGNYYEGDMLALPIQPVTDWPAYEAPPTGSPEAPNGWGTEPPHQQLSFPCYYREGKRE